VVVDGRMISGVGRSAGRCLLVLLSCRYCSDVNEEIPGGCDAVQGSFSAGLIGVRRARCVGAGLIGMRWVRCVGAGHER